VHGPGAAEPVALLVEAAARFRAATAIHTLQGIACQGAYEPTPTPTGPPSPPRAAARRRAADRPAAETALLA
jgi:hypothetical protein